MEDHITSELSQEKPSEFHQQLLNDCRYLVDMSRRNMSEYYSTWDKNDMVYRSTMPKDEKDRDARDRKEPEKMVVPLSYAQVQTFKAFCTNLYTQRDRFFEINGFTVEDDMPAKVAESLLARDLRKNKWEALLDQFILDIARFGVGVFKCRWSRETRMMAVKEKRPGITIAGIRLSKERTVETMKDVVTYLGNRLMNISPYRFFPDTRLPIVRFHEGEFVASEEVFTRTQLRQWEKEGEVAGIEYVKNLSRNTTQGQDYRWDAYDQVIGGATGNARGPTQGQTQNSVVITEVQRDIIPSEYKVNDEPIGDEDYPIKWNIWIANDSRIIKAEKLDYPHGRYTYESSTFIFDNNIQVPQALQDSMDGLQSTINWFVNSRIANVRKVLSNFLVVDPAGINMDDLSNRKPVIRLKASASGGIDRYIKQLDLTDVTAGHIGDVQFLKTLLQEVTGISDALLGQFQGGRRPATEHRNVQSGAASRLKSIAAIIYWTSLEPLADQMIQNLRDGLDEPTFVRLVGAKQAVEAENFISVTREDMEGDYEFEVFDGTLPSDKVFVAQTLTEIFTALIKNPQIALAFGLDLKKILFELLRLRGVRNPERFELSQSTTQNGSTIPNSAAPVGPNGTGGRFSPTSPESLLPAPAGSTSSGGGEGY